MNGITLEDGLITPDSLAYADSRNKAVIGIEIHSGKNRIVRRIFEKLGYDVRNLDRVMYANLTKKNVERGKWRYLNEKEIRLLKFMNSSYAKKEMSRELFSIIYETDDFVAVNKPAGLLSIPDREGDRNFIKEIIREKNMVRYILFTVSIENTSGLIVFAKTEEAHKYFSQLFEERTVEKYYVGIVKVPLQKKKKQLMHLLPRIV